MAAIDFSTPAPFPKHDAVNLPEVDLSNTPDFVIDSPLLSSETSDDDVAPLPPIPSKDNQALATDFTPYPHHGNQFTLYNHDSGMNLWKICFVLEELQLTYNDVYMDFAGREHKSPAYLQLNPNGKIPTLVDHSNGDFAVWESNAIIKYLVERYDPKGILRLTSEGEEAERDKYRIEQWLFFQASGQGPYFGQAQWFLKFHKEHVPSAIQRYQREIKRVFGVLDRYLEDRDWLVGDKCTIADLAFLKYNEYAAKTLLPQPFDFQGEFPNMYDWHQRMMERPSVQYVFEYKEGLRKARPTQSFEWNVEGERI